MVWWIYLQSLSLPNTSAYLWEFRFIGKLLVSRMSPYHSMAVSPGRSSKPLRTSNYPVPDLCLKVNPSEPSSIDILREDAWAEIEMPQDSQPRNAGTTASFPTMIRTAVHHIPVIFNIVNGSFLGFIWANKSLVRSSTIKGTGIASQSHSGYQNMAEKKSQ